MADWTVPVPEDGSLALAARSDGCCCRPLHGINGIVDGVQGPACLLGCLGRHRPLHGVAGMHGAADTPWGQATWRRNPRLPQTMRWLSWQPTPPKHACADVKGCPGHRDGGLSGGGMSERCLRWQCIITKGNQAHLAESGYATCLQSNGHCSYNTHPPPFWPSSTPLTTGR